jgi:hypothetical protein
MARARRWEDLSPRQQYTARKIAEELRGEGWAVSPVRVGEHFGAAMLWRHGAMETAAFARITGAAPAPAWDPDIWLRIAEGPSPGEQPGEASEA